MRDALAAAKSELRRQAEAKRNLLHVGGAKAGISIAAHFATIPIPASAIVGVYVPIRSEADSLSVVRKLRAKGHKIALPRIHEKNQPLHFHEWPENKAPMEGSYRLPEPAPDWPDVTPDVILVPLLAFDAKGHRLGYGGGYYDRTLSTLRASGTVLAVGIAFAGQEVDALPADTNDQKLDWVVTETASRKFES